MKSKIDYSAQLNPAQEEAVRSTEGPHLVIAGAGSGKTRVLVYRTAYLVEGGVDPQRILLLTFTRRASREMLTRASLILDERCQRVSGGTFHSFANAMLRKHTEAANLHPYFTILDQADAENALQLIRTRLGLGKIDKRFPKKHTLLSIISTALNKNTSLENILFDEYQHFVEWLPEVTRIAEEYSRYKKALSLLDFDDLLIYFRDLLNDNEALRESLSEYYRYIMVDEYQDTNFIQAEIVRLLGQAHQNIMVVGDDSQSIYGFRGAQFQNIMDFPKVFPGTKRITLEQNYRSSQPILDLTNEVIQAASQRFEKVLFTENKGSGRPRYVDVLNENSQSRYVVSEIRRRMDEGVALEDMAVLFRSGWHSNDLEVELSAHGIPFVKYGGQKFVEASHVKDVISFLQIVFYPYHEISWLRVLSMLKGIGAQTAAKIAAEIIRAQKGFFIDEKLCEKKEPLRLLLNFLKGLDTKDMNPAQLVEKVIAFYYPLLLDLYDDYDKRVNDLDSLARMASRYDSLEQFLSDMALEPPETGLARKNPAEAAKNHLVLSTIHSAKGLEWNTVFILFMVEGYLPSYRALDSAEAIEEERRLFYVAATRAKENLYLMRPQLERGGFRGTDYNAMSYTRLSRFLLEGEILQQYVEIDSDHAQVSPGWSV